MRMSRSFTAFLAAVVIGPLLASPAWAHDSLVSSDPPDGAVLEVAPSVIELEFTGNILELNPALQVTDADGEQLEVGEALVDGTRVSWELGGPVRAGDFAVVWAVTSQDGHPIDGSFTFAVESGAPDVEPETTEPDAAAPGSSEPSDAATETAAPEATLPEATAPEAAASPDSPAPSPGATAEDGRDISRTAEMWFFAGLVVTVIAVVAVVLAMRRGRDPNGPPGQS